MIEYGVVGDALIPAYEEARKGSHGALAGGDPEVGRALFDKLDCQVKLWLMHTEEVPTFIVNGAPGLEITQDINWYLSEYPDCVDIDNEMSTDKFKEMMNERYGVTYDAAGRWTHIDR